MITIMRGLHLWGIVSTRSWLKRVLEGPNMDYEFNSTKQPSHITMGYNSANCIVSKIIDIANKLVVHLPKKCTFRWVLTQFRDLFSIIC